MFFAKVSTGFKSGGFNLIGTPPAGKEIWDPEEIISYEIGWKGTLLDHTLRLNTSAFHYDYDDLQVASIISFARITENAAKASINGIELEALYQPADAWVINLSLAWLDAKFDSWTGCDPKDAPQVATIPYDCDPLLNPDDWQDFSGNTLVNSPEWSANGGIQYTFDFGEVGTLTTRAQGHWQDEWFLRPYNVVPEDRQDSYAAADVRLIWRSPEETWYLEGFINNVGDTVRATSVELTNGGFFGGVIAPRMWGVRVGFSYGSDRE
jgi:iron complex outermembrane receptor protein